MAPEKPEAGSAPATGFLMREKKPRLMAELLGVAIKPPASGGSR